MGEVTYESDTAEVFERYTPEYSRRLAMGHAEKLAADPEHRARVADLHRRIEAGEEFPVVDWDELRRLLR